MTDRQISGQRFPLILASASPRRQELLQQIGVDFSVCAVDMDESVKPGEQARDLVQRLAMAKARSARQRLICDGRTDPFIVLGADTIVVLDDQVLGKPADQARFFAMWQRLSGRTHQVMTAVALACHATGNEEECQQVLQCSEVSFRTLLSSELEAYWASGEPCDKAGGYAIQGYAAVFIHHLSGSYSSVMGLPLFETDQLLRRVGFYGNERA